MTTTVSGGRLFADALTGAGIDTVFALAGGHVMRVLDACVPAGIRVIDTRHEGAAAFAAEGWALATGRPGFAVATLDQRAIATPGVKWAATCYETARIPRYVAEAVYRARAGRPGAVYLEVPQDALAAEMPAAGESLEGFPAEVPRATAAAADL